MEMFVDRVSSALVRLASCPSGRSGLDKKRAATKRTTGSCAQSTYLSTDGTTEEYYADVQTIIEKNGIDRMLEGKWWRRRVDGGCGGSFFRDEGVSMFGGGGWL
jgi:hypothetical protein